MSWIRRETERGTVQYICSHCSDYHEFQEDFGEHTFNENFIFCRRCGARNGNGTAPTLTPPNEPLTPCDLCRYNPPSSFGGKPCCMCPAEAMTKEDNQNEKSNAIACLRGKLKSAGGYQWIRERKEEV